MNRIAFVALLLLALTACAAPAAPKPTENSLPAATFVPPTVAPTATNIPTINIQGAQVPDPKIANPTLFDIAGSDSIIPRIAANLSKLYITISPEGLRDSLAFASTKGDGKMPLLDPRGNPFYVAYIKFKDGNGVDKREAIAVYSRAYSSPDDKVGVAAWQEATPGLLGSVNGLLIGSNIRSSTRDKVSTEALARYFNAAVLDEGFKYRKINPVGGDYNLTEAYADLHDAASVGPIMVNNIVRGKDLFNKTTTFDDGLTGDQLIRTAVVDYITHVVGDPGIQGKVWAYEIGEPGEGVDSEHGDPLMEADPEYLAKACKAIKEADPHALVTISIDPPLSAWDAKYDYGRADRLTPIVNGLYEAGLMDAVIIQGHMFARDPQTVNYLEKAYNSFKTKDGKQIPVIVGEMDYNMIDVKGNVDKAQVQLVESTLRKILELGSKDIFVWENDQISWIVQPPFQGRYSPDGYPTLFDKNLLPKPAYESFVWTLTDYTLGVQPAK